MRQEAVYGILTVTSTFYCRQVFRRPEFGIEFNNCRFSGLHTGLGDYTDVYVQQSGGFRQKSHQSFPVSTSVITERFYARFGIILNKSNLYSRNSSKLVHRPTVLPII
jgi:hypothetical protein